MKLEFLYILFCYNIPLFGAFIYEDGQNKRKTTCPLRKLVHKKKGKIT